MNVMNLSINRLRIMTLMILLGSPGAVLASGGCFYNSTDGSQWFESVIVPSSPLLIEYNNGSWDYIEKFDFDFGHYKIENPRSFSVEVLLAKPTTEAMSISGILENVNSANGGSNHANSDNLHMNLNNDIYFSRLVDGKLQMGLGRTGSNEVIKITQVTARFCGVAVVEGVKLNAVDNNIGVELGEFFEHNIDSDTTYRVTISGEVIDENGNKITSVGINYIDPRDNKNKNLQLTQEEQYIHTDGKVALYYAIGSHENVGGHNVKFERVNLN